MIVRTLFLEMNDKEISRGHDNGADKDAEEFGHKEGRS